MIIKIGNIFDSKCSTIVNTVNCVGVMGKGIALDFKKKYPEMYEDYVLRCVKHEIKPGCPYIYQNSDGEKILNFPTKDHWRSPSRLSYVIKGLDWICENYQRYQIDSIAFPPLGCGNGGLKWRDVGPVMYQKLEQLPIPVEIYAPYGTPKSELSPEFLSSTTKPKETIGHGNTFINPKWYLILEVVRELNARKYALMVGRTIYQKICYVITRNGIDTGFQFIKASYGPFSKQVKESITILANANMIEEKQLGRMISLRVSDFVNINKNNYTNEEWTAMKKTVDLFSRVKNTEQAEIITTVLFAYDQLKRENTNDITDADIYYYVLDWKPQWKGDKELELCDTIQNMAMLSQIKIIYSHQLVDTIGLNQ